MSRFTFIFLVSLLSTAPASAGVLNDFNLIAFGNVTGTSEVEGRAIVFGDISGNAKGFSMKPGNSFKSSDSAGGKSSDGLIVGGQVKGQIHVNNGGVQIGGDSTRVAINNAKYVNYNSKGVQQILKEAATEVAQTTKYFDSLTANSKADLSDMNTAKFISTPGADKVSVFDVDASLFNRNGMMDLVNGLNAKLDPAGELFLFRVRGKEIKAGSAFNVFGNEFGQAAFQQRIVWYFPDATKLSLGNGLGGAVIAPNADISFRSPLKGTVVGMNIQLNGEIHMPSLILPQLPAVAVPPANADVPEPATIASVGLILCGAIAARYRRRAKRA